MKIASDIRYLVCVSLTASLVLGCSVLDGDDNDTPTPATAGGGTAAAQETVGRPAASGGAQSAAGNVRVLDAAFGTAVDEEQRASGNVGNVFGPDTKRVYAVLVVQGASAGDVVSGRWYKLDASEAPAEGALIDDAGVELEAGTVSPDGIARVALNLTAAGEALSEGQWLVRVYLNEALIRTMAFIILPGAEAAPTGLPPETAPAAVTPSP